MIKQRGLTLLEMLVVLTLVGMISGVLFQGYGYMMGSYMRIQERQLQGLRETLITSWWQDSLEGLVPYLEGDHVFSGSARALSGVSFTPLFGTPGVISDVAWELKEDNDAQVLYYSESGSLQLEIARWEEALGAQFEYLDDNGDWNLEFVQSAERDIPAAVRVSLLINGDVNHLTAVVPIRRKQEIPSSVVLFGRE